MSIDISTHQLAEKTFDALNGKVSLEDVLSIWHSIGNVIKSQLIIKKGVKLSSFGTFTVTEKGVPVFIIASDLKSQFKLIQKAQPASANIPTSNLNFVQVIDGCDNKKLQRETVDKVYSKFLSCIGRSIFEGRNILITFHRVAEVSIVQNELHCEFIPQFLNLFQVNGEVKKNTTIIAQKQILRNTVKNIANGLSEEFDNLNLDNNPRTIATKGVGNRPQSAGYNPITGAATTVNNHRLRPSSTGRPNSAQSGGSSSTSLMYSPRPQYSYDGNQASTVVKSGLKKADLDKFNKLQNESKNKNDNTIDPRRIAAKALDVGDIIDKVRKKIVERGGTNGIRSMSRLLMIMDDNGDKRISRDELKYGLRDYGIDLTPTEIEQVFLYFDRDRNGYIDCTEFLVGLRGDLNDRRKKFVRMAFNILDTDSSGIVTVDEIMSRYDFTWHPEVRGGKKTIKEAAREFIKQWDRQNDDGLITPEEFEDYYKEVSASIDDDDYFELMIRNAWRISGGTGAAANTANKRVLITNKDGSQSVQTINNELGMKAGDVNDARKRLAQQGVNAASLEFHSGVDNTDKTKKLGKNPFLQQPQRQQLSEPGKQQQRSSSANPRIVKSSSNPTNANTWLDYGPNGGDQSAPPDNNNYEYKQQQQQPQRTNKSGSSKDVFDPFETLNRLLYSPPIPMEPFCTKLQVSSVSSTPRIAMGAFIKRFETLDPSLTRHQLKELWKAVDPGNVGSVEVSTIHTLLASRYGKDKSVAKSAGVIEKVIKKILERCGEKAGIKGLQRTLSIMDNNGDKRLSKDELKYGLQDYGLELNIREMDEIFNYFDRDRNGVLSVDEFLIGVRGDMNDRRKVFVRMAFNILDTDNSGYITVDEIMSKYDFSHHPEVKSGKKTPKQAMKEFMSQWDDADGDGSISYAEFEDYYKGVSASIDGDDYFELMMRNAWRISGGTGAAANTANKRVLITNKDGSQSVQTINNELGMKAGDVNDARKRLAQQGVNAASLEFHSGVDNTDKAKRNIPSKFIDGVNRDEHVRHAAAAKLSAAYRGRQGRKEAAYENRKQQAQLRVQYEEEQEINRPQARQVLRPKGKSYIGF